MGDEKDVVLDGGWVRIVNGGVNIVGGDLNLLGVTVRGLRVECRPIFPVSPEPGMIVLHTDEKRFYGFDGEHWKPLSV